MSSPTPSGDLITNKSRILCVIEGGAKQREQSLEILDFSEVLEAAALNGLGRSPYKICGLNLSSLKANKNLEFLGKI